MDAALVRRVLAHATGADIHAVSGLVQEYMSVDRVAVRLGDKEGGSEWRRTGERIERCLRLYVGGTSIGQARRISGCHPGQAS